MWTKKKRFQAIIDIAIPQDDEWHDIQIINNELYIDGELVAWRTSDKEFTMFGRPLTNEELNQLHRSLIPIEEDEDG